MHPKVALAHHEPVAEEQSDSLNGLPFWVVLPVLQEHVLDIFWSAYDIHVGAINRRPVNVAKLPELLTQPSQKVLAAAVLLDRSLRYTPESAGHLMHSYRRPQKKRYFEESWLVDDIRSRATVPLRP